MSVNLDEFIWMLFWDPDMMRAPQTPLPSSQFCKWCPHPHPSRHSPSQLLLTCQFWLSHIQAFLFIPTTDPYFGFPLIFSSQLLPVMRPENPLTSWNLFSFSLKAEGIINLWPLSTALRKVLLQGSLWTFPEDSLCVLWQYKKACTVGKVPVRSQYESKSYARLLFIISPLSLSLVVLSCEGMLPLTYPFCES